MVYDHSELDTLFHALADPTRRQILQSLAAGERNVGQLAEPFAITLAAASKHIKVLERAGLVRRRITGRTHLCSLEAAPMHAGLEWMRHYEKFWSERLDILEGLLNAEDAALAEKNAGTPEKSEPTQPKGTKP